MLSLFILGGGKQDHLKSGSRGELQVRNIHYFMQVNNVTSYRYLDSEGVDQQFRLERWVELPYPRHYIE